jgi:hypothetical protein
MSSQVAGDADPGVISEGESEDDFTVSRIFGLSENIEELNYCLWSVLFFSIRWVLDIVDCSYFQNFSSTISSLMSCETRNIKIKIKPFSDCKGEKVKLSLCLIR